MRKILPLEYITEHPPVEALFNVGDWFEKETMTLTIGESTGRPNPDTILRSNIVIYLLGNGWIIQSMGILREGGSWKSKVEARSAGDNKSHSEAHTTIGNQSTSKSEGKASALTESSSEAGVDIDGTSLARNEGNASSENRSEGTSNSSGSSIAKSDTTYTPGVVSTTDMDGAAYWYASRSITLTRTRLKSKNVLQDMIRQFTVAFNRGAKINNERYDEIVNLYAIMLDRTEDEIGGWTLNADDFKPLVDEILAACKDALANFRGKVEDIPDDWMQSRIDEINLKFDKLLEETRSRLITQGMYNGTVWPTTESGIERDRQIALTDLKDQMVTVKIDAYGKIATLTTEIGGKVIDAATKLCNLQAQALKPTEMRNAVFKWMLDFMERRDDEYPGLESVAQVATALGGSDGASIGGAS